MKKKIFVAAVVLIISGWASAANFSDLAVKASTLKAGSAAGTLIITPAVSEEYAAPDQVSSKWYGADSRRARLQFNSYMHYRIPDNYTGPAERILSDAAQHEKISELLALQLKHMYGTFTMHPGFENNPGIPSGDYTVNLLGAEKVPGGPYAKISYSYDDIVVFSKSLFAGGGSRRIRFVLPRDPAAIYSRGFPTPGSRKNRCTDDHYNSEDDFWYFWNPYQEGCPINGGDLVTVQADLKPMNVTRGTYPDYARLYGDNGGGDVLQVTYLVGVDENFRNGDIGKKTFKDAFAALRSAGFQVTVDEPRRKRLSLRAGAKRTSIDMHLADPATAGFARLAVHGMKTSDIFLYDGHSGLGGYLDPQRLKDDTGRRLTLPLDKYQVFYFQGCSTYAYYNSAFFNLKRTAADPKGSKNLDIITTGIGAAFEVGAKADVTFLVSIAMGQRPSWQTIIDRICAAEGDLSSLTHINGDEDNPRAP